MLMTQPAPRAHDDEDDDDDVARVEVMDEETRMNMRVSFRPGRVCATVEP